MKNYQYPAFSAYGVELEHMIVSTETLDVMPIADQLLELVGGAEDMDVERGAAAWSNELALHVIESKTNGPIADLNEAPALFRAEVNAINELLAPLEARLMPGGMHPWMDPAIETKLWPHQNNEIYSAFDRIFNCQGHGWSNLQSMHINFPFQNEEEFVALHAAIRVLLPILPALCASTPFWEGQVAPHLDQRLAVYQNNCSKLPLVTGQVIPENIASSQDYEKLLQTIYEQIAPLDPEGTLQEEWLNARGAIARFDRGAIEIRVIDTQECPEQDLAIAFLVTEVVKALAAEKFCSLQQMNAFSTAELKNIFDDAVRDGGQGLVKNQAYRELFSSVAQSFSDIYGELIEQFVPSTCIHHKPLQVIVEQGNLAERLRVAVLGRAVADRAAADADKSVVSKPQPQKLREVYRQLCDCLRDGTAFTI